MFSMTFSAQVPPTATLPLRWDRPWWSDVWVMPSQVNVTKPGHCMMITRLASHIIVSAIRLIIMSPPVVNAVAVSRAVADLMVASLMPRLVALVALHAALTTLISVWRSSDCQSDRRVLSDVLMFIPFRVSRSALTRSMMLLPCRTL